jgi:hypothetical protein
LEYDGADEMTLVDDLKVFIGKPFRVNPYISIKQPTIGQIVEFGESNYWNIIMSIVSTPTDLMSPLADIGVDWEKISDFELFALHLRSQLRDADCDFIFDGLRLTEYKLDKNDIGELVLRSVINPEHVIDANIHRLMAEFLRELHGLKYNLQKAGTSATKKVMIEVDRMERRERESQEKSSSLRPLISAAVNSSGYKYNIEQTLDLPYCQFIDCIKRLSIIKHADALSAGAYSGMADLSKVPKEQFNWMRALSE